MKLTKMLNLCTDFQCRKCNADLDMKQLNNTTEYQMPRLVGYTEHTVFCYNCEATNVFRLYVRAEIYHGHDYTEED